jgi:hypothetical protein
MRLYLVAHPALVQGCYYVLMGLWPVLHSDSFLAVTGHTTDVWLVQTLGLMIAVIGSTLCLAAYRRQKTPEVLLLALGSAVVLAGVHFYFVLEGPISAIYLVDMAVELGMAFLWFYAWFTENVVQVPSLAAQQAGPSPPAGQTPVMTNGHVAPATNQPTLGGGGS